MENRPYCPPNNQSMLDSDGLTRYQRVARQQAERQALRAKRMAERSKRFEHVKSPFDCMPETKRETVKAKELEWTFGGENWHFAKSGLGGINRTRPGSRYLYESMMNGQRVYFGRSLTEAVNSLK